MDHQATKCLMHNRHRAPHAHECSEWFEEANAAGHRINCAACETGGPAKLFARFLQGHILCDSQPCLRGETSTLSRLTTPRHCPETVARTHTKRGGLPNP